ncbi:hypothetical protein F5Y17DRAFT_439523 [Xylariaceae sp. FL0594]|nr:hypothetical protein F5Y17DRAFT_439523 [Xylariaceae sp. FL0594]
MHLLLTDVVVVVVVACWDAQQSQEASAMFILGTNDKNCWGWTTICCSAVGSTLPGPKKIRHWGRRWMPNRHRYFNMK